MFATCFQSAGEKSQLSVAGMFYGIGHQIACSTMRLQFLTIVSLSAGEKSQLSVAGMFYGIGHQPNTSLIEGQVELDEKGYVKVRIRELCNLFVYIMNHDT